MNESEMHIDDYTAFRKARECAKGGGILLYVSNNIHDFHLVHNEST